MTTSASIGYGAILELWNGSAFVTVGEVTNLTPPGITVDNHDATHNESTGGAREFIAGLIDYGEIKAEMNLVPDSTTDQLLKDLLAARSVVPWRITLPPLADSPSHMETGNGILTGYEREAPLDDKMAATLTIKVTGVVNFAA